MNCPNCNAATTSEDVFCPNCGFRLRGGAEESVESQPSSETTNAASPTDSDYTPTPSSIAGESTETQQSTDSTSASSTDSDYTYPVDTSSGDDQPENAAEPSLDDSDARAAEPEPRPQYESAPSAGADDQATQPETHAAQLPEPR
ncbi:MAG: zinc ribbon domain-containing protein [Chloroflexia bacterium]